MTDIDRQMAIIKRGVAELISTGAYETLDLSPLGWQRLLQGQPLLERNVI